MYKKLCIFHKYPIMFILLTYYVFTFLLFCFLFSETQLPCYQKIYFPQSHCPHSLVASATCISLFPHIFNFSLYWLLPLAYEHAFLADPKTSTLLANVPLLSFYKLLFLHSHSKVFRVLL